MDTDAHQEQDSQVDAPRRHGGWQERVFPAVLVGSALVSLFQLTGAWVSTSIMEWYLVSSLCAAPVVFLHMWRSFRVAGVGSEPGHGSSRGVSLMPVVLIFIALTFSVGALFMGPVMVLNTSLARSEATSVRGELVSLWEDKGNAALPWSRVSRGIVAVWEGESEESRLETTGGDWRRLGGMENGKVEKIIRRGALGIEFIAEVRPLTVAQHRD